MGYINSRGNSRGNNKKMSGGFSKRGGGVQKSFSSRGGAFRRGTRPGFSPKGNAPGGIPRGGSHDESPRNMSTGDFSSRGRGSSRGGNRGKRGSWLGGDRSTRNESGQEQTLFPKRKNNMDFKKRVSFGGMSKDNKGVGTKNKGKFGNSLSEPTTPTSEKFIKNEIEQEDEELSVSDMEDEEMSSTLQSQTIATETSQQKSKKKLLKSKSNSTNTQAEFGQRKSADKKDESGKQAISKTKNAKNKEKMTEKEETKTGQVNKSQKKSKIDALESNEYEEEDDSESFEDEDDESFEDEDEDGSLVVEDEDGSVEDEDEEENPIEIRTPQAVATSLKSAFKTPGTGQSLSKKVSLSATAATTPDTLSKGKTPVTPHPQKRTSVMKKLKFGESDESDEDEDVEDEGGEEDGESDSDEENKKKNKEGHGKKIVGEGKKKVVKMCQKIDVAENDEKGEGMETTDNKEEIKSPKMKTKKKAQSIVQSKGGMEMSTTKNKKVEMMSPKQTNVVPAEQNRKGLKRKFDDGPVLNPDDAKDVIGEEQRRREERDRKSLFVKGLPKDVKQEELKALHDGILHVRHMPHRNFAWLIFDSEDACDRAYEKVSKQVVGGRALIVDFCGAKAKTRPHKDINQLPLKPLELFVGGLPPSTSKDQMKIIFQQATNITFPKQARNRNKLFCFVQFSDEKEAREAFEKGKTLKVGGAPVDVLYARMRKSGLGDGKPKKAQKTNKAPVTLKRHAPPPEVKSNEVNEDTTNDELESSDEGILEMDSFSAQKSKKARLGKTENSKESHGLELKKRKKINVVQEAKQSKTVLSPKLNGSVKKTLSKQSESDAFDYESFDSMEDEDEVEDNDDEEDEENTDD